MSGEVFKVGQLVMVKGDTRLFEVRGTSARHGGKASALMLMAASGRGFIESKIADIFIPTTDQLNKARKETEKIRAENEIEEGKWRNRALREKAERHRNFLISRGIVPTDSNLDYCNEVISTKVRTTHCFECRSIITNANLLECSGCGWIICSCGACGCSHPEHSLHRKNRGFGKNHATPTTEQASKAKGEERIFDSFDSARDYIRGIQGATLQRGTAGNWTVRIKDKDSV